MCGFNASVQTDQMVVVVFDSGKVNKDHNFFIEYLHVLLLFLLSNKLHELYEQFG